MNGMYMFIPPILAVVGLIFMAVKFAWVKKQDPGNEKMQSISKSIKEGALAFLAAEYRLLLIFVVIASILLFVVSTIVPTTHWIIVVAFIVGAIFSALAGNIGMRIATDANARTAEAAKTSLPNALKVSFGGGTVMGLGVAGLAVLGLSIFFIIFLKMFVSGGTDFYGDMTMALEALAGFSLGAESIALFARVGGGIYTKAADVGADLVGKVEAGIPEDDPRNPATIADNVGDNVGDVAGMGADLFGSYVATVLAAMVLGNYLIRDMSVGGTFTDDFGGLGPILLPLIIAGVGILASIIGTFLVGIKDNNAKEAQVQRALDTGNWVSIIITLAATFFLIKWLLPDTLNMHFFGEGMKAVPSMNVFWAACIGLAVGALISMVTAYFTSLGKKPVMTIVQNSSTGAATNIIAGLAVGMKSTFSSVILFAAAIYGSYYLAGFYGVALAASAMMATTAMQLAIDAFGPIADNAGGVAEMSELEDHVRERTDILDSVGNTTAAVGKGFAIASAALTALALFAAYVTFTGIDGINIFKADVLAMLFVGGMIPVIFSALAMESVGKAAMEMVKEVRRQFKEIPGIMEGTGTPDYAKCVDISTQAALRQMILPGLLTIVTPILVGMLFGAESLGGYMAGVCVSGVMWAIFQNNAGGAWDNAKKSFEAGVEIDGKMTYKGSDAHKAAVTGDTVGDPFKDTSGPSMNILIKLTCLVGLVIAPILGGHTAGDHGHKVEHNMIGQTIKKGAAGAAAATAMTTKVAKAQLDKFGNYVYDRGSDMGLNLKSGANMVVGTKSSERKLYSMMGSSSFKVSSDKSKDWVTLDRTYFATGSANIKPESKGQLRNIAMLLEEYPNASLKIGGYTDNTGDAALNQKLSAQRADSVRKELIELGVSANRLRSEGYGSQHPLCPANDTDICKAKNRRVDVRVTKK